MQGRRSRSWPLFGRSLGKGHQSSLCTCAIGVYSTVYKWFYCSLVVGYEPDHHIFASYGPVMISYIVDFHIRSILIKYFNVIEFVVLSFLWWYCKILAMAGMIWLWAFWCNYLLHWYTEDEPFLFLIYPELKLWAYAFIVNYLVIMRRLWPCTLTRPLFVSVRVHPCSCTSTQHT